MNLTCPEAGVYLDKAKPERPTFRTDSVFQSPQMVDKRPWLAHAFTELLQVQRSGKFEPGIGDFRVSDKTLNTAGRILGSIRCRYLPSPSVFALSGGGIQINWANRAQAVEVSVFPDAGVGVARLVDDVPIKAVELGAAEYWRMNDFLADFMGA